jgi:hypothetical protein
MFRLEWAVPGSTRRIELMEDVVFLSLIVPGRMNLGKRFGQEVHAGARNAGKM